MIFAILIALFLLILTYILSKKRLIMIKKIKYMFLMNFYSFTSLFIEFYNRILRNLSINQPLYDETRLHEDLSGCVCFVNGCAGGDIGSLVIEKLLKRNCYLIIGVHGNRKLANKIKEDLLNNQLKNIDSSLYHFEYIDLTSFQSIINLVHKFNNSQQKINFFISNAGIALDDFHVTENVFEKQLQINYLGSCLLLIGLLPLISKTAKLAKLNNEPKSKIVYTNSCVHKFLDLDLSLLNYASTNEYENNFSTHQMYCISKLYQLMFNFEFNDQFIKQKKLESLITFINIHPGIVNSGLLNNFSLKKYAAPLFNVLASIFLKKPEEGALNVATPILSQDKFFESKNLLYLEDLKIGSVSKYCYDKKLKEELFNKTMKLLDEYVQQLNIKMEDVNNN